MNSKTFELKKLEPLYLTSPRRKFWTISIDIRTNQTIIKYGKLLHDGTEKAQTMNIVTKPHDSIRSAISYVEKATMIKLNKDYKIESPMKENNGTHVAGQNSHGKRPLQNPAVISNDLENGFKKLQTEIQSNDLSSSKHKSQDLSTKAQNHLSKAESYKKSQFFQAEPPEENEEESLFFTETTKETIKEFSKKSSESVLPGKQAEVRKEDTKVSSRSRQKAKPRKIVVHDVENQNHNHIDSSSSSSDESYGNESIKGVEITASQFENMKYGKR